MTTAAATKSTDQILWQGLSRTLWERLPLPFVGVVVTVALLVVFEQLLEESLIGPRDFLEVWQRLAGRIALPLLSVYLLLTHRLLKREVIECLTQLQPSVKVPKADYDLLARKMVRPHPAIQVTLLLVSALIVLGLFTFMHNPLPIGVSLTLPPQPLSSGFILITYILIGWLGLSLVYAGTQHAYYLSQIARRPLQINVFDPENLLPFGSISLLHSLVLAGVIVILTVLLGRPTSPASYLVIILTSFGSLMALLLPLLGVFLQMRKAKILALNKISAQLMQVQNRLMQRDNHRRETISDLNAHTNALVNLRKTLLESPNWPFRSSTAVFRALVAALSPLIYFLLIELVRVYIVPLFTG
jgi:hypothetical protein